MQNTVLWDSQRKHFTINGKAVAGVHPTLQSLFYPNYSFHAARNRGAIAGTQHQPHTYYGRATGIRLDNSIETTVDRFVETGQRPKLSKLTRQCAYFWQVCQQKGWVPIGSQIPVGCPTLRVATRVDAVCCEAATGNIVVLEIKSGYTYYKEGNGMLSAPYTDHNNSPLNQHHLQLLLNKVLYQRTFPRHIISHCYILRFEAHLVDLHPLASWAVQHTEPFLRKIESKKTNRLYRNSA